MKSSAQALRLASRQQDSRKRAARFRRGLGLEQLEAHELMTANWGKGLSFTQGPFLTEFQPGDDYYVSYGLNVHHLEGSNPPQDHTVSWGMRLSPDKSVTLKDQVTVPRAPNQLAGRECHGVSKN